MSGVGSSRTDAVAVAWSFPAGTSWGAPGTEPPSKPHYLSHEALPIGDHKQSYAAELRQVLADSAETPFALPPAAAEELRRICRAVTESSARAKERSTALHGYIQKLEKYQDVVVLRRLRPQLGFHHERPMNILGTKPADTLAEFVPTGSTPKQQQEGMSGVGSSRPDANAWSFHAGTSWGAPPTEPLSMAQYLSHEMLPIGNYKHSCARELWWALADLAEPLLAIPPAAAEELRRIHRGVTESSARAKDRAKALHGSIHKLEKYQNDLVWQRQRTRLGFHHRLTFQELRRITDGFSEKRLLGKGGFGMVYRGVLDDGEVIAVKKLNPQQGLTGDSFRNEIQNLMRVQHQNIISLVGYCEETRDRVVEYEGKLVAAVEIDRAICLEYMQGGSLEKLLSDESGGLDWEARYRIIKGTCQGLQHLHTGSENPIYHLDLNPANILLDKDQIPKIGDFGLSRLLPSPATFVTKTNSGTLGYMPPEYMHGQQISSKFDVFSLGIIIIKVIAGPDGYFKYKCLYTSPRKFMDHVTQNWSKRVQARPMSAVALQKVKKCIKMALRCVEDDRAKRPTITEIVKELNMIS